MAENVRDRAQFYREVLEASRESGVRLAQEVLLEMDRRGMSAALARALEGVRRHLEEALGCSPPEVDDGSEAFAAAAVAEWTRIRAAMGSGKPGLA